MIKSLRESLSNFRKRVGISTTSSQVEGLEGKLPEDPNQLTDEQLYSYVKSGRELELLKQYVGSSGLNDITQRVYSILETDLSTRHQMPHPLFVQLKDSSLLIFADLRAARMEREILGPDFYDRVEGGVEMARPVRDRIRDRFKYDPLYQENVRLLLEEGWSSATGFDRQERIRRIRELTGIRPETSISSYKPIFSLPNKKVNPIEETLGDVYLRLQRVKAPHEVLGISPTASAEQAHVAYRRLTLLIHPDRIPEELRGISNELTKKVNGAYQHYRPKTN